jgi:hypothetical protein
MMNFSHKIMNDLNPEFVPRLLWITLLSYEEISINDELISYQHSSTAGSSLSPVSAEIFGAEGRFTLWPSKLRGCGIKWPNFVESPKKWAENI